MALVYAYLTHLTAKTWIAYIFYLIVLQCRSRCKVSCSIKCVKGPRYRLITEKKNVLELRGFSFDMWFKNALFVRHLFTRNILNNLCLFRK